MLSTVVLFNQRMKYFFLLHNSPPRLWFPSCVGISIDYSLFLLSRFRDEIRLHRSDAVELAVLHSFVFAGHTIIVSGLTLASVGSF